MYNALLAFAWWGRWPGLKAEFLQRRCRFFSDFWSLLVALVFCFPPFSFHPFFFVFFIFYDERRETM